MILKVVFDLLAFSGAFHVSSSFSVDRVCLVVMETAQCKVFGTFFLLKNMRKPRRDGIMN